MEAIDSFVNRFISPSSLPAGVGTVFLTFFSTKLAPQMPQKFYKLIDNVFIRVVIVAFLLNQQIKSPSKAILISVLVVVGLKLVINVAVPDAPPLSEIVHPSDKDKDKDKDKPCNCNISISLKGPPGMTIDQKDGSPAFFTGFPGI